MYRDSEEAKLIEELGVIKATLVDREARIEELLNDNIKLEKHINKIRENRMPLVRLIIMTGFFLICGYFIYDCSVVSSDFSCFIELDDGDKVEGQPSSPSRHYLIQHTGFASQQKMGAFNTFEEAVEAANKTYHCKLRGTQE